MTARHLHALEPTFVGEPNILLIHGAWHGAWVWDRWSSLFDDHGYRALAIDLPGHGDGDGDRSYRGVHLSAYVSAVKDFIADLATPPILVGHSLGGLLIQHLLGMGRYPAAVLLASIPPQYPAGIIGRIALRHPWVMTKATVRNDLRALVATPALVRENLFTDRTPQDVVDKTHARLIGAWPGLFREMVTTQAPEPQPGTPTLVVAPDSDPAVTPVMQKALAARLGADYFEIANCGHDVPVDEPWREAAGTVLDWLDVKAPGRRSTTVGHGLQEGAP